MKTFKEPAIKKLCWLDMEMTGLLPEKDVIIEVGCVMTDMQFNELESYENVVHQDQKHLDGMDKWNQKCHRKSGLYPLIAGGRDLVSVETDLLHLIEQHFSDSERVVLAGNCIFQDRSFIRRHMPRLEQKLFYRMLDVSSWKLLFAGKGFVFEKENRHRALSDTRESIKELRFYLQNMSFHSAENPILKKSSSSS